MESSLELSEGRVAYWVTLINNIKKKHDVEFSYLRFWQQTRARSSKSFTLFLYVKTIRTKQAKVQFVYSVQRDQHGIIAKYLT